MTGLKHKWKIMGIEYFIIALDDSAQEEDVLNTFSPFWTKNSDNTYSLDYPDGGHCVLSIDIHDSGMSIKGAAIFKPCSDTKLERSVFNLIQKFPMFMTYPTSPLTLVTANQYCVELVTQQYPELIDDLTFVHSFEEYLKT